MSHLMSQLLRRSTQRSGRRNHPRTPRHPGQQRLTPPIPRKSNQPRPRIPPLQSQLSLHMLHLTSQLLRRFTHHRSRPSRPAHSPPLPSTPPRSNQPRPRMSPPRPQLRLRMCHLMSQPLLLPQPRSRRRTIPPTPRSRLSTPPRLRRHQRRHQ